MQRADRFCCFQFALDCWELHFSPAFRTFELKFVESQFRCLIEPLNQATRQLSCHPTRLHDSLGCEHSRFLLSPLIGYFCFLRELLWCPHPQSLLAHLAVCELQLVPQVLPWSYRRRNIAIRRTWWQTGCIALWFWALHFDLYPFQVLHYSLALHFAFLC